MVAQTLGQVHSTQHSGRLHHRAVTVAQGAGGARVAKPIAAHVSLQSFVRLADVRLPASLFLRLWVHEDGSPDCQLYDQLGHDGAVARLASALLPVQPLSQQVALFAGEALARWAAQFNARAPPLTS